VRGLGYRVRDSARVRISVRVTASVRAWEGDKKKKLKQVMMQCPTSTKK
jgi:hypothetical protein